LILSLPSHPPKGIGDYQLFLLERGAMNRVPPKPPAERHWRHRTGCPAKPLYYSRPSQATRRKALETITKVWWSGIINAVPPKPPAERHWRPPFEDGYCFPVMDVPPKPPAERHWRHGDHEGVHGWDEERSLPSHPPKGIGDVLNSE